MNIVAIEIGTNVTSIGQEAFYGCSGLASVAIGNRVTSIEGGAFSGGNSSLINLTIPSNVTSIGYEAFSGCHALTSVTFEGKNRATVQGMTDYPFGLENANENGVTIHCTDGDIQVQYE